MGPLIANFSKQLSCLPQVYPPPPTRQWPPSWGDVSPAPPRPPQEHCGQIWRTQQLGSWDRRGWGGPGWDRWQLVRGRGWPQGQSRRGEGPPWVPSAGSLARASLLLQEHWCGRGTDTRTGDPATATRSSTRVQVCCVVPPNRECVPQAEHAHGQWWAGSCSGLGTGLGSLPWHTQEGQPGV